MKEESARRNSRDKGPAPPPPSIQIPLPVQPPQPTSSPSSSVSDKGPAPLPPVPLPVLPTPPTPPPIPPSPPTVFYQPLQTKKVKSEVISPDTSKEGESTQKDIDVEKRVLPNAGADILDAAFNKILSDNIDKQSTNINIAESAPVEGITIRTTPSVTEESHNNLVVVSTSQLDQNKLNTSTIIINDIHDPSNSLASNISQVDTCLLCNILVYFENCFF